ncbi:MAG TPA: ribonuclease HI [Candidatus Hydrogenedentes bacterium]|nr:ribonuclease HI [Candidatus Hydrogenedentota bacterium]
MNDNANKKKTPAVTIYTDGGCEPNPGVGGWGAVLIYGNHVKELSGGEPFSTNNRMELTAAIAALSELKRPCKVKLHSDSIYLVKGMTEWIHAWKRKQWRRGSKPVLNLELWQTLDALSERHDIKWIWVRGHDGNRYNERCDRLAGDAILAQKNNERLTE